MAESFTGFTDRPAYADARRIAERLIAAYVDGEVDRVEIFYNGYQSAISQVVRRETLLPLQQATVLEEETEDEDEDEEQGAATTTSPTPWSTTSPIPRRSSSAWSPTTWRFRSTVRCSSPPRPSTVRA